MSDTHGSDLTSPSIAVASPAMPSMKFEDARFGYFDTVSSSIVSNAPLSAKVRSFERPICRRSGPSPEATAP